MSIITLADIQNQLKEASKYFPDDKQSATVVVRQDRTEVALFFMNGVRTERVYRHFNPTLQGLEECQAIQRCDHLVGGNTPPVYHSYTMLDGTYINLYVEGPIELFNEFLTF